MGEPRYEAMKCTSNDPATSFMVWDWEENFGFAFCATQQEVDLVAAALNNYNVKEHQESLQEEKDWARLGMKSLNKMMKDE